MTGLRVSELAARAGVPPSTVRFYERAGLLSPARRSANGYRVFSESVVSELTLIRRAKGIGMSLDEIASAVATWRDGSCACLRTRLHAHLTAKIAESQREITGMEAFQERAQFALAQLSATGPVPNRCGDDCGCDSALIPGAGKTDPVNDDVLHEAVRQTKADGPLPGCSLDHGELAARLGEWQTMADTALSSERNGDILRLVLDPAMIPAAASLLAAEAFCCTQARFTLDVTAGQVTLTAEVPGLSVALPPD